MQQKAAFFDICYTLVRITTISNFTEQFLLSRDRNHKFLTCKWVYHILFKILRRLHIVSPAAYRRHYIYLFKGYSESDIDILANEYVSYLRKFLKPDVFQEFTVLKNSGYTMYLVTAGLDGYLKPFAKFLGATLIATELEKDVYGRYTGALVGDDCIDEGKVKKIASVCGESVDWNESYAFGNDTPDIPMLSLVGNPIAIDPDIDLRTYAVEHKWKIRVSKYVPKKIVYLITALSTGGAEITLRKLVNNLDPLRYTVTVISFRPLQEIGKTMQQDGIDVRGLGMGFKYNPLGFIRLWFFLRKHQPDILHTFLSHANIIGRIIGRLARVSIIISSVRNEKFGRWLRERLLAWTDRFADMTTIVSQKAADRVLARGIVSKNKSIVIRNGYDLELFHVRDQNIRSHIRKELGISDTAPVLISEGSLTEQKGYPYLLDAMVIVKKQFPNVKLLIAGEGILRNKIESQIDKLGLNETVRLLGLKTSITDYYNAADVFALASLWEGFSNVIVEAMACGLPVVVTDVGGAREAVANNVSGYIVLSRNSEALAEKILQLLNAPHMCTILGNAARETVEKQFSLQTMMHNYEMLYEKMLGNN